MASQRRQEAAGWTTLSSRRSPPHDEDDHDTDTSLLSSTSRPTKSAPGRLSDEATFSEECFDSNMFIMLDDKYACPICMMVLRDPVQTTCGHRFGRKCLEHWFRDKSRVPCPICQKVIQRSETFPDNFAKREIMSLMVRCRHHADGCQGVMELRQLEHHEDECQYAFVLCPNGCPDRVQRITLDDHLTNTCSFREKHCPYCSVSFKVCELEYHENECPDKRTECRFCHATLKRKEMEGHLQMECPDAVVDCGFRRFGCQMQFVRSKKDEHMRSEVVNHLYLVSQRVPATASASMRYCQVPDSTSVTHALASISTVPMFASATDPGFCSDYSGTSTVYSTAANRCPVAHSMEAQCSDVVPMSSASHVPMIYNPPLMPDTQEKTKRLGTYPLLRNDLPPDTRSDATIGRLQAVIESQKHQIESQAHQIQRLQEVIRQQDRELHEVEGRLCKGVYIWRLRDYSKKRHDAVTGKTTVHHSPGFYTDLHGYKMCVRANLNGVESATGTHLSLFVHLLQGDYDELLSWPFQGFITLSVLDQSPDRNDITEKLVAKSGLTAFLKPVSKRNNKGFGYIEFAPLSSLCEGKYIKNDTMLIKVEVHDDDQGRGAR